MKEISKKVMFLVAVIGFFVALRGEYVLASENNYSWNQYDDTNQLFVYYNMVPWANGDTYNFRGGNTHVSIDRVNKSSVRFNFEGAQFGLRCQAYVEGRNYNMDIYIDGQKYNVSSPQRLINGHYQYYLSPVLRDGEHSVVIEKSQPQDGYIFFDLVDIKGILKAYRGSNVNFEAEKDDVNLGDIVEGNLTIKNVSNVVSEQVILNYDSSKLDFIKAESLEGMAVRKCKKTNGQVRLVIINQSPINDFTKLAKLYFKAKGRGSSVIYINDSRISGENYIRSLKSYENGCENIIVR